MENKLYEILFLQQLKGIGPAKINNEYRKLIEKAGSADELANLLAKQDAKYKDEDISQALAAANKIAETVLEDDTIQPLTVFDIEYPTGLNSMKSKRPPVIYVKGAAKTLNKPGVAVIGTREPSEKSKRACAAITERLVMKNGLTIYSGLALGCDGIAHKSALNAGGCTVAVLPGGFNYIYPAQHKALAEQIIGSDGCLISEYIPETKATNYNFVKRDTLVAALSIATLVIECGLKSGTMHTVDDAIDMNRPLACYYPEGIETGFEGNEHISRIKGTYRITTHSDLDRFAEMLTVSENTHGENVQQKLWELL